MEQQIDNSHFKPINNGLGFHHSQKFQKNKEEKPETIVSFSTDPTLNTERIPSALSPFYSNTDSTQEISLNDYQTFEDFDEEVLVIASPAKRLAAWSVDMGIVSLLVLSILSVIKIANGYSLSELSTMLQETPVRWGVLFSLIYLFYFTILEKSATSTLGKSLIGLVVKTSDESRMTLDHTLVRAVVGLGNIATMGFLALFSFQDKISETQVLER